MLTEEKIRDVKNVLEKSGEVQAKVLLNLGVDKNDIIRLKKLGVIESSKWGHYKLGNLSNFYDDAVKAVMEKDYDKAKDLFEKSINNSFNVMEATYYLFMLSVMKNDLDSAFKYLDVLYNNKNDIISNADLEFYLYMINFYCSVPSEYYQLVRNFMLSDDVDSSKKYIISKDVKYKFFNGKTRNAISSVLGTDLQSSVIKFIIFEVVYALNVEKNKILQLIKEKDFEKLYDLYLDIDSYRNLKTHEKICLDITSEINEIFKSGGVLPKATKTLTNTLSVAVGCKDYKRALEINREFNKNKSVDINSSHLSQLLIAINEIIDNIDDVRNKSAEQKKQNSYSNLVNFLINGEIKEFIDELKSYLERTKKSQYLLLVMNLVKIDTILEDKSFTNTMLMLSLIVSDNFVFDMSEFVMNFYENLALNRFDIASIYLDILEDAKAKNFGNLRVNGFRAIFESKVSQSKKLFSGVTGELVPSRKKYSFQDLNIPYSMDDLISNKVLMLDRNVDIDYVREVVNDLDDVACFEINIDGEIRVMLKYKEKNEEEGVNLIFRMN